MTNPDASIGNQAIEHISFLLWGVVILIAIPVAIILAKVILKQISASKIKKMNEAMKSEVLRLEKKGDYVSAAVAYEKLSLPDKAATMYEKGSDFANAARLYEVANNSRKVREMWEKAGDLEKAAFTCMMTADYIEAARIYNQIGNKQAAAEALEMSGNKMAAVRAYREIKDYGKASELLEKEGLLKEAAEMLSFSLAENETATAVLNRLYKYADLIEKNGDRDAAIQIFKRISSVQPDFRDVSKKISGLNEDVHETKETYPSETSYEKQSGSGASLRNIILSGRMEPRYSFRLWFQVLRAIENRRKEGQIAGNIHPESIVIDTNNSVTFLDADTRIFAYTAPEVISGQAEDMLSAIYSMGIILYEMLAGGLDSFGMKIPSEVMPDVPSWLDEITMKCVQKDRSLRYQSADEIFSVLKTLKAGM